ncbi:MAG: hypothetical protein IJU70_00860 [Lentisphaeria bacterium]|nr:hypothetical protein [Lentisphaeria bacterium]
MAQERDFSKIDRNYGNTSVDGFELEFHPGFEAPAVREGFPFFRADGRPSRIPEDAVRRSETDISNYSLQGAGEEVRFRTDSPYFGIRAVFSEVNACFDSRRCSTGFDAYIHSGDDIRFAGNQVLPFEQKEMTAVWNFGMPEDGSTYDVTLIFPALSAVGELLIGLKPGSRLEAPTPHRRKGKLVFYGSSLTHRGTASRPGLRYPSLIGRMLDIEIVNMGLCGRCFGELPIADAVASLDPAAFVLEFDHNAPTPEFLAERHEKFFRYFRSLCPETPVLMISRPGFFPWRKTDAERRNIIARTWLNAVTAGDRHVDFLDGETLFAGPFRYECTDDNCHQNNLGEALMAERIADRLRNHVFLR